MAQNTNVFSSDSFSELNDVDKLLVKRKQRFSKLEFTIRNEKEEQLFNVSQRFLVSTSLECNVKNMSNIDVLHVYRPLKFSPSEQKIDVTCKGYLIGQISQHWGWLRYKYTIYNENGDTVFIIIGPTKFGSIRKVYTSDGATLIAKVTNISSFLTEQFEISFPALLDVKNKLLILAACFVIMDDRARMRRAN